MPCGVVRHAMIRFSNPSMHSCAHVKVGQCPPVCVPPGWPGPAGEELLVEIGRCLEACRAERLDRRATLLRLAASVPGVYVPQFYAAPQVRH